MPRASASAEDPLTRFVPGIRTWFAETFGAPTGIQRLAWPAIAAGEHVLATAPTGSGKTLTAFLWALNEFASGHWETGATRVLYVSPLKALNNDIQRNLLTPLEALQARGTLPGVRAMTRSGDTPQSERQRMLRRPPEILITTPESLMLLLTTTRGRHALASVETVIGDEIHALVDNRRGTLLLTALERLVELAGEFQRIVLSATVRPLDDIAAHVAGRDADGAPRRMRVLDASDTKDLSFAVRLPAAARQAADAGIKLWEPLAADFRQRIHANRATLFFANSRRLAERLTAAINDAQPAPLAYAHHGSLSREIRLEVERRLKAGELKAIVATSSLEMGIDIGELDEVVLIQAPPSIAATLQRIGRSGHRVGQQSRGTLVPTFARDFVEAAALCGAVADRDIEPLHPLAGALDVLAQIIVSTTATETWAVNDLFRLLRRSGPYVDLSRERFDLVLEMLAGRYAGSRLRELQPRVGYDRIRGTVRAQRSAVLALYAAGGVIPDRGYFKIRHADSGAVIGELDEEFVWEATTGQVFSLGTQNWQIRHITHNDVMVRPTRRGGSAPPFWRAESQGRSFHYSQRIGVFLETAERLLADDGAIEFEEHLGALGFDTVAAGKLAAHLRGQREATHAPLPHRRHLLAERILSAPGGYQSADTEQLVFHTFWGGRVNRPWALALATALRQRGVDAQVHADDDAVAIQTREPLDAVETLALVSAANLLTLLRRSLESSGFFGARFRESAGRALLLGRQRFNARQPLWLSRMQASKLLARVAEFADFPVLLEAWRTCLNDEFDLPALHSVLAGVADGATTVSVRVTRSPSPFAANLTFSQISPYMYATDRPETSGVSALSDALILAAVGDAALRPRLAPETIEVFEAKRQRRAPGYAPDGADEWADWTKERVLLPAAEGQRAPAHPDLVWLHAPASATSGARAWLCHREALRALRDSGLLDGVKVPVAIPEVDDPRDALQLCREILSFHGPRSEAAIADLLPGVPAALLQDETLISGALLEDDDATCYCDADNLEALLRLQRTLRRPTVSARPARLLPAHVAAWQGVGPAYTREPATAPPADHPGAGDPDVEASLDALRGYDAPVSVWLHDLLAARGSADHELDRSFAALGLSWAGSGPARIRIGYADDLALLEPEPADTDAVTVDTSAASSPAPDVGTDPAPGGALADLFADPAARYGFLQLADRFPGALGDFNRLWWQAVWRGDVSADGLAPLRQGVTRDFAIGLPPGRSVTRPRAPGGSPRMPRYRRAALADPWPGTWFLTPPAERAEDPLDALEDAKERARMLLDRYGVVCRELANREGGRLRWAALFRALRVMELAGEVLAGHFFESLSGPQFVPPAALALLEDGVRAAPTFWCNALDPLSPCGLGLDWADLPQRRTHNYLAFHRGELTLVVENLGKRLTFLAPPEHPASQAAAALLRHLLDRQRRLTIESVNGEPAAASPYRPVLDAVGTLISDHRAAYLERARSG